MKGTIRRNVDNHFINSNVDTDVIVTDFKIDKNENIDFPIEIFHIMERMCLGRKRLFLKFEGQTVEGSKELDGWLTVCEDQDENDLDLKKYEGFFFKDGKVDRYLGTTEEIENLRPKSPSNKMKISEFN